MKKLSGLLFCTTLAVSLTAASQAPVSLGAAANFAVLAGSTVTSTAASQVIGDLGVSPGTAVTGFPPGTVIGTIHAGDPTAAQAIADLTTAIGDAAGRSVGPVTVAGNIGGQTLAPGLYKSTSSLAISSGNLTLDAQGDANAVFIFQMASTLTTTAGLQVILAGGAQASNIFWQVGSSATLGTNSVFKGTIMADQSITLTTGATLDGRALARIAGVTLQSNTITKPVNAQSPVIDSAKKVENGASFIQGEPIAPGSFVAIFGSNFGSGLTLFSTVPLSNSLAGASVTFNGVPAPMIGVTAGQINAQLPWELPSTGTAQVVVTTGAGASASVAVPLTTASPGLFYIFTDSTGVNRPGAYNNADGTLPLPTNILVTGYTSRPSKPGEILILFCTGLGAVTNPPADGAPGLAQSPYSTTLAQPTVLVGGVPANVLFSGLSPQYPSFYQIAITVPSVAAGNAVPLQIQMNGITTTDQLKIAISN